MMQLAISLAVLMATAFGLTFVVLTATNLIGTALAGRNSRNSTVVGNDPLWKILDMANWHEPNVFSSGDVFHCRRELRRLRAKPVGSLDGTQTLVSQEEWRSVLSAFSAHFGTLRPESALLEIRGLLGTLKVRNGVEHEYPIMRAPAEESIDRFTPRSAQVKQILEYVRSAFESILSDADDEEGRDNALYHLDNCMSIAWNLEEVTDERWKQLGLRLLEYIQSLFVPVSFNDKELYAFKLAPRGSAPCFTGCYFALRIVENLQRDFGLTDEDVAELKAKIERTLPFVLRCWNPSTGGFAYSIGEPANVLHTWLALDFARRLKRQDLFSNFVADFYVCVDHFVESCFDQTSGGYAFYPRAVANPHATLNALQIYTKIAELTGVQFVTERRIQEIASFLDELRSDDKSGLYVGLRPSAQARRSHLPEAV